MSSAVNTNSPLLQFHNANEPKTVTSPEPAALETSTDMLVCPALQSEPVNPDKIIRSPNVMFMFVANANSSTLFVPAYGDHWRMLLVVNKHV